jgi:putative glutamine amidotransferase
VNVALGGTLFADIHSQIHSALNHNRMDKRDEIVHQVQLTQDSLMARIFGGQTLDVNSTHHQGVNRVAEPLEVTAISEDGLAEALELKVDCADWLPFFLSVQFHPERLARKYPEHRRFFDAFTLACALSRDKKI